MDQLLSGQSEEGLAVLEQELTVCGIAYSSAIPTAARPAVLLAAAVALVSMLVLHVGEV